MVSLINAEHVSFFHISDIHIQDQRRDEYAKVFQTLYSSIDANKPDHQCFIIVSGDILDSKTKFTAHNVADAVAFLTALGDIYPVIIIPGNHDINMNSPGELDLISALGDNLRHSSITYYRNSGDYNYKVNGYEFNIVAIIPNEPIPDVSEENSICIFHEDITRSDTRISELYLSECIACFGGHIHGHAEVYPNTFYSGSLIQQNFGEPHNGHGYLIWELHKGKIVKTQHIEIPNESGFVTYQIENNEDVTPQPVPANPRCARVLYKSSDAGLVKEYVKNIPNVREIIDTTVKTDSVTSISTVPNTQNITIPSFNVHELLTLDAQIAYIDEILDVAEFRHFKTLRDEIINIHRERFPNIYATKTNIGLVKIEFDNLFSFGRNNVVEFNFHNTISGVIAENATGKSAIIDIILYALFDVTSRGNKQTMINKKYQQYRVELTFELDGKIGKIKKTGNSINGYAHTEVVFIYDNDELTCSTITATLELIESYVGTYANNTATTISLQNKFNSPVCCSIAERKTMLCKLIGFDEFDKVDKELAKRAAALNGGLKQVSVTSNVSEMTKQYDTAVRNNSKLTDIRAENQSALQAAIEARADVNSKLDQLPNIIETEYFAQDIQAKYNANLELIKQMPYDVTNETNEILKIVKVITQDQYNDVTLVDYVSIFSLRNVVYQIERLKSIRQFDIQTYTDDRIDSLRREIESMTTQLPNDNSWRHYNKELAYSTQDEMDSHKQKMAKLVQVCNAHEKFIIDGQTCAVPLENLYQVLGLPSDALIDTAYDKLLHLKSIATVRKQIDVIQLDDACPGCVQVRALFDSFVDTDTLAKFEPIINANMQHKYTTLNNKVKEIDALIQQKTKAHEEMLLYEQLMPLVEKIEENRKLITALRQNKASELKDEQKKIILGFRKINRFIHLASIKNDLQQENLILKDAIEQIDAAKERDELQKQLRAAQYDVQLEYRRQDEINKKSNAYNQNIAKLKVEIETARKNNTEHKIMSQEHDLICAYRKVVLSSNGVRLSILNRIRESIQSVMNDILFQCESNLTVTIDSSFTFIMNALDVSLSSGFQSFMISLAFRLAISKIAQVPLVDCLIIDEGFSCLDINNMNRVTRYLERASNGYRLLFIISHIDEMKNAIVKPVGIWLDENGDSHVGCGEYTLTHDVRLREPKRIGPIETVTAAAPVSDEYYCDICNKTIKARSRFGHFKSVMHVKRMGGKK